MKRTKSAQAPDVDIFLAHSREWLHAYQIAEATKAKVAEGLVDQIAGINIRIDAILNAIATHGGQPPGSTGAPDIHGFPVCREDVRARKAAKRRAKPAKRGPRG